MSKPVADVLRRAAARCERGIVKNRHRFAEDARGREVHECSVSACRWCVAGAIWAEASAAPRMHAHEAVARYLNLGGYGLTDWFYGLHGAEPPTQAEVVAALRAAADAAEREGTP